MSTASVGAPADLAEQVRAWEEAQDLVGSTLGPAGAGSALERQLAKELDVTRQRLAYYERFDSLINDSIQRSADLFHAIVAEREEQRRAGASVAAEITAAAEAELERRVAAEGRRMQDTLMALMAEAGRMQRQVDSLIQQIADAVTELSSRGGSYEDLAPGA